MRSPAFPWIRKGAAVSKKEIDKLLDHEYDGIQELDNPLPGWWLATFYGAIIFSFFYVGYYHIGPGPSTLEEVNAGLRKVAERKTANLSPSLGPDEATLLAALADPGKLAVGREQYMVKCASCHMAGGEGSIGPNLNDSYWIHGDGKIASIAKVIADGVPEKGMPPWKGMMSQDELVAVSAYVHTLKGLNPGKGKAPQGNEIVP